jgi:hypothetical protein
LGLSQKSNILDYITSSLIYIFVSCAVQFLRALARKGSRKTRSSLYRSEIPKSCRTALTSNRPHGAFINGLKEFGWKSSLLRRIRISYLFILSFQVENNRTACFRQNRQIITCGITNHHETLYKGSKTAVIPQINIRIA